MSPTPILDRQKAPPAPKPPRRLLWLAVGAAVAAAPVFVPLRFLPTISLATFALMAPALFMGILLHELGHVFTGLLAGFEFRRLLVGPWTFSRERQGLRLRFLGRRFIAGGQTLMLPRSPEQLRRRYCLFLAGGPTVTLLLFLPAAVLPWGPGAQALFFSNVILALGSWVPMVCRGHYTDAKAILVLMRRRPEAERLATILYLVTLDGQGIQPRDWPAEAVAKLSAPCESRDFRASARMLLHIYLRETASPADAASALEKALAVSAEMSGSQRLAYFSEAAFFQGVYNRSAELARAWLADARTVKGVVAHKDWDASAMAAAAFADGREVEFHRQRERALSYLDRLPGPSGSVDAFRQRLMRLSITEPAPSTHRPGRG